MDWEQLRGQLETAVRTEAVKAIDQAIERLQQLRAEYTGSQAPEQPSAPIVRLDPPAIVTTAPVDLPSSASAGTSSAPLQPPTRRMVIPPRKCMVCRRDYQPTNDPQLWTLRALLTAGAARAMPEA